MMQIISNESIMCHSKVLIFAPHPDDEILGCSSIIKNVVDKGVNHKIIIVTSGEDDMIGALMAYSQKKRILTHGIYVGAVMAVIKTKTGLEKIVFVSLRDNDNNPEKDIAVEVINEQQNRNILSTNELGWVIIDISPNNLYPQIRIGYSENIMFRVKNNFRFDFINEYAKMRINESYVALEALGVKKANIEEWGSSDGSLSRILATKSDSRVLKEKISIAIEEYIGGAVIIPHPKDIDEDHCALSKTVQKFCRGLDIAVYKYMIHPQVNHALWPKPEYIKSYTDRCSFSKNITIPDTLMGEQFEEVKLSQVGLTGEMKYKLIQKYITQCSVDEKGFLGGFAKNTEIFYRE